MEAEKACRIINSIEEFALDKEALGCIDAVVFKNEAEMAGFLKTLCLSFWGLPKDQAQQEWIACVVHKIGQREDGLEVFQQLLQQLELLWGTIDIRRIQKFALFLKQAAAYMAEHYTVTLAEYVKKGPNAQYELAVIEGIISAKQKLSDSEVSHLIDYLATKKLPYFREFFAARILPLLEQQGVSKDTADRAFRLGNSENTASELRQVLYSVAECVQPAEQ